MYTANPSTAYIEDFHDFISSNLLNLKLQLKFNHPHFAKSWATEVNHVRLSESDLEQLRVRGKIQTPQSIQARARCPPSTHMVGKRKIWCLEGL